MRGIFDLDGLKSKISDLELKTTAEGFWSNNQTAQTVLKQISSHKKWLEAYGKLVSELSDTSELIDLVEPDSPDAKDMGTSIEKLEEHLHKLEMATLLSGPDDARDAIITIHPGAGGTESQDWAEMLFRMYSRWAERREFEMELLDYQPGEEAGLKSATMQFKGDYAYGFLKAESGVHRLVRISPFDANARRHTSFASVHASPFVEDAVEIEIKDEDLRIDTYRSSGAGGQHVNKTESAIRITHFPTGIVVTCQTERSQIKNREAAFAVLRSRLYQHRREEEAKRLDKIEKLKKRIDFGSQIRSYVFHPYNMVKDHRTDCETSNVQAVMDGDIDRFIEAFISDPDLKDQVV